MIFHSYVKLPEGIIFSDGLHIGDPLKHHLKSHDFFDRDLGQGWVTTGPLLSHQVFLHAQDVGDTSAAWECCTEGGQIY